MAIFVTVMMVLQGSIVVQVNVISKTEITINNFQLYLYDIRSNVCNSYLMCNFTVDACRPPGGPDIICENDGYCIPNQSDQGWECLCKQDFYGKNCETRKYYLLLIIIFVTILSRNQFQG